MAYLILFSIINTTSIFLRLREIEDIVNYNPSISFSKIYLSYLLFNIPQNLNLKKYGKFSFNFNKLKIKVELLKILIMYGNEEEFIQCNIRYLFWYGNYFK